MIELIDIRMSDINCDSCKKRKATLKIQGGENKIYLCGKCTIFQLAHKIQVKILRGLQEVSG